MPKTIFVPGLGSRDIAGDQPTPQEMAGFHSEMSLNLQKADPAIYDNNTGAPPDVRMGVGSLKNPEDRLAQIRKTNPEAIPEGADNFLFVNPATGAPTRYNPPGFDRGDIYSVAPEMGEAGGAVVGAGVGALLTAGAGLGTGGPGAIPVATTIPLAMGTGALLGRNATEYAIHQMTGAVDTRPLVDKLTDQATTFTLNAAAPGAGRMIEGAAKTALGPVVRTIAGKPHAAEQAMRDATRLGIDAIPAGVATGARGTQLAEKGLGALPGGIGPMTRQAEAASTQIMAARDKIAAGMGKARDVESAGRYLKDAALSAAERIKGRGSVLYDDAYAVIPKDAPIDTAPLLSLRADIASDVARSGGARSKVLQPALDQIDGLLNGVQGGMTFDGLRATRTDIGRALKDPGMVTGYGNATNAAMGRVYGALTEAMNSTVEAAGGPEAKSLLGRADWYHRAASNTRLPILEKIAEAGTDAKALDIALSGAKDGGKQLWQLRRSLPETDWGDLSATVFQRLGEPVAGQKEALALGEGANQFSISSFVTNWNKLSDSAKSALFGGKQFEELRPAVDAFARTMGRFKDAAKLTNTSNTAQVAGMAGAISVSGTQLVSGQVGNAGLTILGTTIAPNLVARGMTSPKFVRWLTTATNMERMGATEQLKAAHLAKLRGIVEGEEGLFGALGMASTRPNPAQPVNATEQR